ncbi:MAG: prolipoprotein diacylglyceryl transferase [Oligoflexia bacterium]|nr:prolipoprotein diacylglyceryl transferase [Oligoflexia bacterium]
MFIHKINPIIFSFQTTSYQNFELSWYWPTYVLGILLVYFFIKMLERNKNILFYSSAERIDFLLYSWVGLIICARAFYVLFYDFKFYLKHPNLILQFWNGGMSFHGGALGVLISLLFLSWKYKRKFSFYSDVMVTIIPCALALGRLGNFLNSELVGRVSEGMWPWLVHFSYYDYNEMLYRHPSQLYQMLFECLFLFVILWSLKKNIIVRPGLQTIIFLYWISVCRFIIEFFREADKEIGLLTFFTAGQILSIVVFMAAIITHAIYLKKKSSLDS